MSLGKLKIIHRPILLYHQTRQTEGLEEDLNQKLMRQFFFSKHGSWLNFFRLILWSFIRSLWCFWFSLLIHILGHILALAVTPTSLLLFEIWMTKRTWPLGLLPNAKWRLSVNWSCGCKYFSACHWAEDWSLKNRKGCEQGCSQLQLLFILSNESWRGIYILYNGAIIYSVSTYYCHSSYKLDSGCDKSKLLCNDHLDVTVLLSERLT